MGLKEEIREELEEQEKLAAKKSIPVAPADSTTDNEFHGIGWNMLHKKFVEGDI